MSHFRRNVVSRNKQELKVWITTTNCPNIGIFNVRGASKINSQLKESARLPVLKEAITGKKHKNNTATRKRSLG